MSSRRLFAVFAVLVDIPNKGGVFDTSAEKVRTRYESYRKLTSNE